MVYRLAVARPAPSALTPPPEGESVEDGWRATLEAVRLEERRSAGTGDPETSEGRSTWTEPAGTFPAGAAGLSPNAPRRRRSGGVRRLIRHARERVTNLALLISTAGLRTGIARMRAIQVLKVNKYKILSTITNSSPINQLALSPRHIDRPSFRDNGVVMGKDFTIAIVGGGPAGISAAVHAAQRGVSHVLLESKARLFGTVDEFPKSKPVMAAPDDMPMLSDLPFGPGSRESVIEGWASVVRKSGVNVRLQAEVTGITGQMGEFAISLAGGETVTAEYVVLSVGVHGNRRKLPISGADVNPRVHYRIDDPAAIQGEQVVVIGRGDAAIEDALALAANNEVAIVHRGDGFGRANPTNARRIEDAIRKGAIQAYGHAELKGIADRALVIDEAI